MQNILSMQEKKRDLVDLTLSRSRLTEADLGASRLHVSYGSPAILNLIAYKCVVSAVGDWLTCQRHIRQTHAP